MKSSFVVAIFLVLFGCAVSTPKQGAPQNNVPPRGDPSPYAKDPICQRSGNTAVTEAELDSEFAQARARNTEDAYRNFVFCHHANEKHYNEAVARLDEVLHPNEHPKREMPPVATQPDALKASPQPSTSTPVKLFRSARSFNPEVTSLPPRYAGHDIVALYKRLETAMGPKGEYETTEQFQARLQAAITDDLYAFKVGPFSRTLLEPDASSTFLQPVFKYNADARRLDVKLPTYLTHIPDDRLQPNDEALAVSIKHSSRTREYIGTNTYGALADVKELRVEDFLVSIGNQRPIDSSNRDAVSFSIDMPPEAAQAKKPVLSFLLICRLKSFRGSSGNKEVLYVNLSSVPATIDSPNSYINYSKYVNISLLEVWLYDSVTGEILKKHKFGVEE